MVPVFFFWRAAKNAGYIYQTRAFASLHGSTKVLFWLTFPVVFAAFALSRIIQNLHAAWNHRLADAALAYYPKLLAQHYGEDGACYRALTDISEADCRRVYDKLRSERYLAILETEEIRTLFRDGDSFLEPGCGAGPGIKALAERFPHSMIKGFDFSTPAIRVIEVATRDCQRISVELGSLADLDYLASYDPGSFDHVLVAYVFDYLVAGSVTETIRLHKEIINHLVRIAARSVTLITDQIHHPAPFDLVIQRASACFVQDDIIGHFKRHLGNGNCRVVFTAGSDLAVVYRKARQVGKIQPGGG